VQKNDNKPGYKKTKVGWIPQDWFCRFLSTALASSQYGCNAPPAADGNTPVVGMKDIQDGKLALSNLSRVALTKSERSTFLLKKGDVLINRTNSYDLVGKAGILDSNDEVAFVSYLVRLRGRREHLNQKYLNLWLNSYLGRKSIKRIVTKGVSQANINPTELKKQSLMPLPALPEQKAIAEVLDCWDKAIRGYEKKIEKKRNIEKGLMQGLLSGKQRLLGFEGEWKEVRLGDIGAFSKGKGISKDDVSEFGLQCIRYGQIYMANSYIASKLPSCINAKRASQSTRVRYNDVLLAGSGETIDEIGKAFAYIGTTEAYAGGDIIIFSPEKERARADYIARYLNTAGRQAVRRLGQGQSIVHVYTKAIIGISIPLPDIQEQQAIASVLSSADAEIAALDRKLILLKDQKRFLLNSLVTGTIRLPEFAATGTATLANGASS
jgi:type I restriction enzyme, S subunit